jgi:glucoamylase
VVDLDISKVEPGRAVVFTFMWLDGERWDDATFTVQITAD